MTGKDHRPFIEHFEIVRELGRGGMGVVYLARQTALNRDVALKVLRAEHAQAESVLKRFEREAANLVRLKHPNLAHLYDFELSDPHPYLVFELIEGERTLADVITAGAYSDDEALMIILELASVLAYLHENGIVHRDLKPANILMDLQGHVRLADFGLSRDLDPSSTRVTMDGQIVGTYGYMAPEALLGERGAEPYDVYAFGLVAFELFARRILFAGQPPAISPTERASGGLPFLSEYCSTVPDELDVLVTRCVAHRATHRPKDARDVLVALHRIAAPRFAQGFGRVDTIKRQIEGYARPQQDPSDAATVVIPAPATARERTSIPAGLVACSAVAGVAVACGFWIKAHEGNPSPPTALSAPAARSSAPECDSRRTAVSTALVAVLGEDGERLERLLERLRGHLKVEGTTGAFRELLALVLGGKELAHLEGQLRLACPIESARSKGTPVDHALLSRLNLLEVFDELAISLGEPPLFEHELARLRGPFARMRELGAIEGEPVLGFHGQPSFRGPEPVEWQIGLPAVPERDAELTFVVNDLDPKTILEVTVNGVVRLTYRNRSAIAGATHYEIPPCHVSGVLNPRLRLAPGGPFPKFTVLTRRVPRSALRVGDNRLRLRFVILPGPLRLPNGKIWQTSSKLSYGTVWHAYLTFP